MCNNWILKNSIKKLHKNQYSQFFRRGKISLFIPNTPISPDYFLCVKQYLEYFYKF